MSEPLSGRRVALAHDWLVGYRGGEAVLERIAASLEAVGAEVGPVFTMFSDSRAAIAPRVDRLPRVVSTLNRLPGGPRGLRRWLLPAYPLAVADLSRRLAAEHRRRPFDLLVSTSSSAVKSLRPPPGVPHLCYCHSPARYLWSQMDRYAPAGRERLPGALRAVGLRAWAPALRRWDRSTAGRVTRFLANSAHTAREIERCYGRAAEVLHPPVRTGLFTPDAETLREDFWLAVGALEPYKRTHLAVRAARLAGRRLVVAGSGSLLEPLRREHAGSGVEFLGRVPDERLVDLYRRARVLLFPQVEDFGIVPVEAMACGCPVAARGAGGALDTVVAGVTGAFSESDEPEALADAGLRCEALPDPSPACRAQAERFAEASFDRAFLGHVFRLLALQESNHGAHGERGGGGGAG